MVDMIEVQNSSSVAAIGWEADDEGVDDPITEGSPLATGTLTVRFTNGRTYTFDDVPEQTFNDLRDAPSVGTYFARNIRHAYAGVQV